MTRVSFSAADNTLSVKMPQSWTELTQQELCRVYKLMARVSREELPLYVFHAISGMRIVRQLNDGRFLCVFRPHDHKKKVGLQLSPEEFAGMLECLGFLMSPGDIPVRLDTMQKRVAVDAQLHHVTFGDYLHLESHYQGFLSSQSQEAVIAMACILYPGEPFVRLSDDETLNVVNWMVQVKGCFSRMFGNFFRPAQESFEPPSMLEVINNEIRALTGGDPTKEDMILSLDCWRALTELDFKAKEAEEYNRMANKKTS